MPDIPNAVFADVVVPVEGDVEVVELRGGDELERFVGVSFSEGRQDIGEDFADVFFLVSRKGGDGDAGEFFGLAGESDGFGAFFLSGFAEEGEFLLFAVEHLEDFVGAFGLVPIHVAGMGRRFVEVFPGLVSVEDGTAKCGAFQAVSVAAAGDVPPGEDEFELPFARLAEEGDGAVFQAFFVSVPGNLLQNALLVFWAVEAEENLLDEVLLIGGEVFADSGFGDVPIVLDLGAFLVVERQADFGALPLVEAFVERGYQGFRIGRRSGGAVANDLKARRAAESGNS